MVLCCFNWSHLTLCNPRSAIADSFCSLSALFVILFYPSSAVSIVFILKFTFFINIYVNLLFPAISSLNSNVPNNNGCGWPLYGDLAGKKRPVPRSLSKKNISYVVFIFNIISYFTVNNFVINVGRRKEMLQTIFELCPLLRLQDPTEGGRRKNGSVLLFGHCWSL